jgi:farnesyl-diphosphate farnesyltransferase
MVSAKQIIYLLFHPQELRLAILFKLNHRPVHTRDVANESDNVKECYRLLGLTSRSFVAVIQELHPELLMPVVVFYLVLRALDTIEDDMTLDIELKEPLLRDFHGHLHDESWTFDGSGPDEKDREALVKFDCVAKEFNKLKKEYRDIISDIAKGMGNGMADYARLAHEDADGLSVKTIKQYELYCHYVAGLVGDGLTRMFVEAKFADPALLLEEPELMESMGQFLQQINITRDIWEDYHDGRFFWPEEVWSKYVQRAGDLLLPQHREKALQCSSEMVFLGMNKAGDCLAYMERIKEQSTFNFVAIPQAMAIATFEVCFQNPALFERNVKISRGAAYQIMMASTKDFRALCEVFTKYARKIREKNNPADPHFDGINRACERVERFAVSRFPSLANVKDDANSALMSMLIAAIVLVPALMVRGFFPLFSQAYVD